jgi:hypothetical protein
MGFHALGQDGLGVGHNFEAKTEALLLDYIGTEEDQPLTAYAKSLNDTPPKFKIDDRVTIKTPQKYLSIYKQFPYSFDVNEVLQGRRKPDNASGVIIGYDKNNYTIRLDKSKQSTSYEEIVVPEEDIQLRVNGGGRRKTRKTKKTRKTRNPMKPRKSNKRSLNLHRINYL